MDSGRQAKWAPLPRGGQAEPPVLRGSHVGHLGRTRSRRSARTSQRSWPWRGPPPRRHPSRRSSGGLPSSGRCGGSLVVSLCIRMEERKGGRPGRALQGGGQGARGWELQVKRLTWTGPSATCVGSSSPASENYFTPDQAFEGAAPEAVALSGAELDDEQGWERKAVSPTSSTSA